MIMVGVARIGRRGRLWPFCPSGRAGSNPVPHPISKGCEMIVVLLQLALISVAFVDGAYTYYLLTHELYYYEEMNYLTRWLINQFGPLMGLLIRTLFFLCMCWMLIYGLRKTKMWNDKIVYSIVLSLYMLIYGLFSNFE